MRIRVSKLDHGVVTIDADPNETTCQIAMRAAVAHGYHAFDAWWCLGEGDTFMLAGAESVSWVPLVVVAAALSEDKDYVLAVMPLARGGRN